MRANLEKTLDSHEAHKFSTLNGRTRGGGRQTCHVSKIHKIAKVRQGPRLAIMGWPRLAKNSQGRLSPVFAIITIR